MSATLRTLINSAWDIAHPDAPVYVGDPAVPANSFIASPLDYANLEGEAGKSYPMCLVWRINRFPDFTQSGYIENTYKVFMYVLNKCNPSDPYSTLQTIIDDLRPVVDKLLSVIHANSETGISEVMIEETMPVLDDHCCGHQISFKIWLEENSSTICEAPELLPVP